MTAWRPMSGLPELEQETRMLKIVMGVLVLISAAALPVLTAVTLP